MAEYSIGSGLTGRQARAYTPEDEDGNRTLLLYDSSTANTFNSEGVSVDTLLTQINDAIDDVEEGAAITEEITATLTSPIGDVKNGTTIAQGTTLTDLAKMMFLETIPPKYTQPSISLTGTGSTSVEAGTQINPTLTSTFTPGDAGAITEHKITKNGTQAATGTNASLQHTEAITMDGSTAITFQSSCTYAEGEIKNDNKGQPYPNGHVTAGTKTSASKTYNSYRAFFYGRLAAGVEAPTTSAEIRALTNGGAASQGKTFTISAQAGEQAVVFAYPATIRDVSSVKYVEAGNDESKALFVKTSVTVEGAGGYTGIEYKVYTMKTAQPFAAAMTFNVTL